MYVTIYINIFITFLVLFIFNIFNFNKFFFNKLFFNKIILLYFFKKEIKKSDIFFKKTFFLPNKIIIWKPIFKKTSYLGYFFNNNNKWK
jgi:hypothetical protein